MKTFKKKAKNIISIVLLLCFFTSFIPNNVKAVDFTSAENISFKKLSPKNCFYYGEEAEVIIKATNKSLKTKNVNLMLGLFDKKNNRILNIAIDSKKLAAGNSDELRTSLTIPITGEYTMYYFLWDNLQRSISAAVEIPILKDEQESVERDKSALSLRNSADVDLLLIRTGPYGSDISWKSNNTAVITDNGEVKPATTNSDVTLTATITAGNISDTKEFVVTVPAYNAKPLQRERNMTDEEFLGIWHEKTGEWILKPRINYDYKNNPILKAAEVSVKDGNYEEAKKLVQQYYISKNRIIENPDVRRNNYSCIEDLLDDVYNKVSVIARGTVTPEPSYNKFDVTKNIASKIVKNQTSFDWVIINDDKNEEVVFDSREGAKPPVLTVVADDVTYEIKPDADSYIRGGKNGAINYGTQKYIKTLDSGMPVDDNSKRIYIRFNMPKGITNVSNIQSAELSLYGFARKHDPEKPNESNVYDSSVKLDKEAKIFVGVSEELAFKETKINWNAPERIRYYSFEGNTEKYGGMDFLHKNKPGIDRQFINTYARFWYQEGLVGKYEETHDETYAARYIRELLCYFTKVGGGDELLDVPTRHSNLPLNAGFREQLVTDSYYALVKSKSMTPNNNLQILKFIYDDAEALVRPTYWLGAAKDNNWGMEMVTASKAIVESFPEFTTTDKNLGIIANRIEYQLSNLIRTDGSYIEATNGYPVHVFENIYDYKRLMIELGYKVPDSLESQIKRFATFFMNCLEPNGYVAEYGDDHYDKKLELYKQIAKIAKNEGDDEMLYVTTYRNEGSEPCHESAFYPDGRWATIRDGWDKNSLFAFTNWTPINVHAHNDVLSLTLTAYGRRLLADTSDKSYNNEPISNWQRVSRFSHSVVAIDDTSAYQLYNANWGNPNMSTSGYANFSDTHDILTAQLVEKMVKTDKKPDLIEGNYISNRKITFFKPLKFFIVSDYLDAVAGERKYTQTWIFDVNAVPSIDAETGVTKTNYTEGANILVVPSSKEDMVQSIEEGYQQITPIKYATFVKNSGSVENFDTVLYPIMEGSQTQVTTKKIAMGDNKLVSAMNIEVKKEEGNIEKGSYYITHEKTPVYRAFGENGTDAVMAYVNYDRDYIVNYVVIQNGTVLKAGEKEVIKSNLPLSDVSVEYTKEEINISSSEKVLANLGNLQILAATDAKIVKFNGQCVAYIKQLDKIYLNKDVITETEGVLSQFAKYMPINVNGKVEYIEVGNTQDKQMPSSVAMTIARDKQNLALGKTIAGAGTEIVDGNPSTVWKQSVLEYPSTITIDLGREENVSDVEVLWGLSETKNGLYKYKFQTSLDGITFVDVKEDKGYERSLIDVYNKARYIRIVIKNNTFYDPIQIREIYVGKAKSIEGSLKNEIITIGQTGEIFASPMRIEFTAILNAKVVKLDENGGFTTVTTEDETTSAKDLLINEGGSYAILYGEK
ncbi:hypothetical protein SH1V18_39490 [Vallitalea longa]|uniref:F5/8 type C domain-containing protein n=1 Tax=Vallitalea longa TaxID=2936439 RepID=A0A9W5YEA2_9FIRM|nr:immunoglobulin-like domain-containing protein [Vallitalea longa]GKX31469.1 hypothetical protein SH1V18_39490 [Vallitalea longa]